MSLRPADRAKLLENSKERAAALLDDLQYLRELHAKPEQTAGELRRASGLLRRLFVERDIAIIAAPRLGRFLFRVPDNNVYYEAARHTPFTFFASGGMEVFGVVFRTGIVDTQGQPRPELAMHPPTKTALVRLDGFLSQAVLCLRGQWITRGDVIKYVANIASGVHSGTASTTADEAITRIRRAVKYKKGDEGLRIEFDMNALEGRTEPEFRYATEGIDPALIELLAAVTSLLRSDDTGRLENLIREELR